MALPKTYTYFYYSKSPVFDFSSQQGSNALFNQIKMQWDPLPHQYANGRLRGYTVYYKESYHSYLRKSRLAPVIRMLTW